jgi:hypothetical protein
MSVTQALAIAAAAFVMSFRAMESDALSGRASAAASHIMAKVREAPAVKVFMDAVTDARPQAQAQTCSFRGARL